MNWTAIAYFLLFCFGFVLVMYFLSVKSRSSLYLGTEDLKKIKKWIEDNQDPLKTRADVQDSDAKKSNDSPLKYVFLLVLLGFVYVPSCIFWVILLIALPQLEWTKNGIVIMGGLTLVVVVLWFPMRRLVLAYKQARDAQYGSNAFDPAVRLLKMLDTMRDGVDNVAKLEARTKLLSLTEAARAQKLATSVVKKIGEIDR